MPQKVILLVIVIAIVAWLVLSKRGNRDAGEAARLARKMAKQEATAAKIDAQDAGMLRLNDFLLAERGRDGDIWTVQTDSPSYIKLPYHPKNGPKQESTESPSSTNPGFVGADACASCHTDRHSGFVQTAHHKTSAVASSDNFHGPVDKASTVRTNDQNLVHQVVKDNNAHYQLVDFYGWKHCVPMDVVTGSAKTGQTYLFWHGDQLFQTHISYLTTTDEWIPSPGYEATEVDCTRVIRTACLDCHATFIQRIKAPNHYHRDTAVWGISCERCHGPGKQHVDYHQQNPKETKSKFISNPSKLTRQQQLDVCGQCHSGSFQLRKPAFSFRPGDNIADFHKQLHVSDKVGSIHTSNQLTRLKKSTCFQQTEMTCTTCHNPHRNEHRNTALFSKRCLQCHEQQHCGMSEQIGDSITTDCISCHMPMTKDFDMPLDTRKGRRFPSMVDHYIRVDQEAMKAYLQAD